MEPIGPVGSDCHVPLMIDPSKMTRLDVVVALVFDLIGYSFFLDWETILH